MTRLFLFGTLRDPALLEIVCPGATVAGHARWPGHRIERARDGTFPVCIPDDVATAEGLLAELTEADLARADFYEAVFGYHRDDTHVMGDNGPVPVQVYLPGESVEPGGTPWALNAWQDTDGALTRSAARDVMSGFGRQSPAETARWMPSIRARAQARFAAQDRPPPLRGDGPGALQATMVSADTAYDRFFQVQDARVRHSRFDGAPDEVVDRAVFVMVDAVTILPYDPRRDRVLLVEQFRAGPFLRGDAQPWLLEAVAGRVDGGESWEAAAQRELREEAGLDNVVLHLIGEFYPSPGAVTEYIISYVGIADPPDGTAGLHGLDTEAEDIRTHLMSFDDLMAALEAGYIRNGPLFASVLWLAARRDALRAASGA